MDEQTKLAFTFASDLSKQLITLATGILALTVTFTKDIVRRITAGGAWALAAAWVFYFLSVIFGIWTLMALTGTLAPVKTTCNNLELGGNIRIPSACQIILFLIATILIVIYGTIALVRFQSEKSEAGGQDSESMKNLDFRSDFVGDAAPGLRKDNGLSSPTIDKQISEAEE